MEPRRRISRRTNIGQSPGWMVLIVCRTNIGQILSYV
jgi:hypothetical protein